MQRVHTQHCYLPGSLHGLNRKACDGFSLVEVLVAATVFTIGLAGFSALLLSSIQESKQARLEAIAAIAAADLAEQIRLNPAAIQSYLQPTSHVTKICSRDTVCSPSQQADFDFRLWQLNLADRIKNARGLVCMDQTPDDGKAGNEQCDGSGSLVIKIFWPGAAPIKDGTPFQHRYVLKLT